MGEQKKMPEPRSIARVILLVLTAILFGTGVYLSFERETVGAATNYGFGVLTLIFYFLPDFESFKGFGLEAKLQSKIEEADATIKQMRQLALPIAELLFILTSRSGRFVKPVPRRDELRLLNNMEEVLKHLGAEYKQIENAKRSWYQFTVIDMARPIVNKVKELIHSRNLQYGNEIQDLPRPWDEKTEAIREDIGAKVRTLHKIEDDLDYTLTDRTDFESIPKELEDCIDRCFFLSQDERNRLKESLNEEFADINYFIRNRELRRKDVWVAEFDHI